MLFQLIEKCKLIFFILLLLSTAEILSQSQNTVSDFSFAPGVITEEKVILPEINLDQIKSMYGKRPHPLLPTFRPIPSHTSQGSNLEKANGLDLTTTYTWMTTIYPTTSTRNTTKEIFQIKQELFVIFNYEQLEEEMAQGQGERLYTLSYLYGCPKISEKSFAQMTRDTYPKLFQNRDQLTSTMFTNRIRKELSNNAKLSKVCRLQ